MLDANFLTSSSWQVAQKAVPRVEGLTTSWALPWQAMHVSELSGFPSAE
jgi:hypothetical protein